MFSTVSLNFVGNSFVSGSNTLIMNGILGESSHHGIQGNDSNNIIVKDVVFEKFEVGMISLRMY